MITSLITIIRTSKPEAAVNIALMLNMLEKIKHFAHSTQVTHATKSCAFVMWVYNTYITNRQNNIGSESSENIIFLKIFSGI